MTKIQTSTVWANSSLQTVLGAALNEAMQNLHQMAEGQVNQMVASNGLDRRSVGWEFVSVSHHVDHIPGGLFGTPRYVASVVAAVAIEDFAQ